jgi:aspartyl-tRNA(Asn)/glutamyl-tRNA(Gln) amidotransferase subunit A
MPEPRDLSLVEAAQRLRKRKLGAVELVQSCLERIEAREPQVRAWVRVYSDGALAEAKRLDRRAKRGDFAGPLHGIPLGIKDIFDVAGMETRAGTAAYTPRVAEADAASVACLRGAGAIVLGKTETTAFADGDPAPTRNPWDLSRTPGGSSSGSGAGVADRMCLGALGSQTAGSVLRPASYNGIVGFKPTHGAISLAGVIPFAWSLDHVGTLTRTVADSWLLWSLLRLTAPASAGRTSRRGGLPTPPGRGTLGTRKPSPRKPRRLWRLRGLFEKEASAESLAAFEKACRTLAKGGAKIVERPLPPAFDNVLAAQERIMHAEAAAYHRDNFAQRGHLYPPLISRMIGQGQAATAVELALAYEQRRRIRIELAPLLAEVDAALTPTTVGPAPTPETTGPRTFQAPWSFAGLPTITLPCALSSDGLPLGVQLVGAAHAEDDLFAVCAWAESRLGFDARPA